MLTIRQFMIVKVTKTHSSVRKMNEVPLLAPLLPEVIIIRIPLLDKSRYKQNIDQTCKGFFVNCVHGVQKAHKVSITLS